MNKTVIGIFSERENAESALEALEQKGFNPKNISIITQDKQVGQDISQNTGASVAEGPVSGASTGAIVGGIAGLLIGIGAITIPGVGALLIAGPLATALGLTGAAATTVSGTVTGALAGGLIGALVGLGVPKAEAQVYEQQIKEGGILVAVPTMTDDDSEVRSLLTQHNASNVRTLTLQP
jgi:hypothetical protein